MPTKAEIFGVSEEWADKARKKYIREEIKKLEQERAELTTKMMLANDPKYPNTKSWLRDIVFELDDKIERLKIRLKNTQKELNVEEAKKYSIPQILSEHNIQMFGNKFAIRNEKTPSCWYYKDTNSYYDFGSGEGGDSIDLYMKLEGCDFVQAVKALTY